MTRAGLVLVALGAGLLAQAAEPPRLTHNPFARPPSERTLPEPRAVGGNDETTGLILTATMVAGDRRLANVDGRLVRPGDEILGHRLLTVFEDRAVFEMNGRRVTIYVKPEREDSDE